MGRKVTKFGQRNRGRDTTLNDISEDEYGRDQGGILYFPNVQSCTTITVLGTNNAGQYIIGGIHYAIGTERLQLEAQIRNLLNDFFEVGVRRDWCIGMWLVGNITGTAKIGDSPTGEINKKTFGYKYKLGKGMRKELRKMFNLNKAFPIHTHQKNPDDQIYYKLRLLHQSVVWSYHICSPQIFPPPPSQNLDGPGVFQQMNPNLFEVVPKFFTPKRY